MTGRELAPAAGRSHEKQIRQVDGADQEHEERACPQEIQGRAHVTDDFLLKRDDGRPKTGVADKRFELRKTLVVAGIQRVDFPLRLFNRRTRLQPRDHHPGVAVARVVRLLIRGE